MNTLRLPEKAPSPNAFGFWLLLATGLMLCLLLADCAQAADAHPRGVLDSVYNTFRDTSKTWADTISKAASWLFWTLAAISLSFTFGMMALRQADMGEFFVEFVRFCMFTGFFWWLLSNAPAMAGSIIESLSLLAAKASNVQANDITPSSIIDMGWSVFLKVGEQDFHWKQIVTKLMAILFAEAFLVLCCIIAVDYLMMMISCWLLLYAGVFVLGFGGSRWTSEMAIGYYKTVLGTAAQLMAMILVIGIGKNLIEGFTSKLGTVGGPGLYDLGVLIIAAIVVMMMVKRLPPMIGGMLTGGAVGVSGVGGTTGIAGMAMGGAAQLFGAGALAGAAISKAKEAVGGGGEQTAGGGRGDSGAGGESGGTSDAGVDASPPPASNDSEGGAGGDSGSSETSTPLGRALGGGSAGGMVGAMASAGMGALKSAGRAAKIAGKAARIMADHSHSSTIGGTAGGKALERMKLAEQNQPAAPNNEVSGKKTKE